MARIIYGVQGEGRGHSSRSKVIIEHLIEKGHQVKIVSSRKGFAYLSKFFDDIINIQGLELVFKNEKVEILKTIEKNIKNTGLKGHKTIKVLQKMIKDFKPDLAITDFEPFVPFVSQLNKLPFISINHQHLIVHCDLDYLNSWQKDFLYASAVTNNMYWFADRYFVTSFYFPRVKEKFRKKTILVGPILRKEVSNQRTKNKKHILIYVTSKENKKVLAIAKEMKHRFIAYGFGKQGKEGNILFKKPSTKGFLKDLAQSKAVITNGGYTLMSEALFFGKPIYSIPIQNQFEQMLNGFYLQKLGYGLYDLIPDKERISMFLQGLDYFRRNIIKDKENFNGNKKFFALLDKRISRITLI